MAWNPTSEELKARGNAFFKNGEFDQAIELYSRAIQKSPSNPLLYTNRANARLKLNLWDGVLDDCLKSIELNGENMKAFYFLGQAQLALHHPNEALSSALRAYELCSLSSHQTSSAFPISTFVLKCKKAKWDLREQERLRRRNALLGDLERKIEKDGDIELSFLRERAAKGEIGSVTLQEEAEANIEATREKINDLRSVFAVADPEGLTLREIPAYLIDDISFEIMHDPVVTKYGHSYERATIVEHLKRNPVDPLTREPLSVKDLRPNLALRKACEEFWENNRGWAYEW